MLFISANVFEYVVFEDGVKKSACLVLLVGAFDH